MVQRAVRLVCQPYHSRATIQHQNPIKLSPVWVGERSRAGRLERPKSNVASKISHHQLNHSRLFVPILYEVVAQDGMVQRAVRLVCQPYHSRATIQHQNPIKLSPFLSPVLNHDTLWSLHWESRICHTCKGMAAESNSLAFERRAGKHPAKSKMRRRVASGTLFRNKVAETSCT